MGPERIFPDVFVPNIEGASYHAKWVSANRNGDAPKWATFRDAAKAYKHGDLPVPVPTMATKYGKALVAAAQEHMSVLDLGAVYVSELPSIPTGLVAQGGDQQIQMSWNPNPGTEIVDVYQVYEADQYRSSWLAIPGTTYTMTTDHLGQPLQNGTTYFVRVSAHNAVGYGPYSAAVAVTPSGGPAPNNRYTDINFAAGKYHGEGIESVFEAYQSDARLSNWGGLPSDYYDNPGAFGYSPPTSMTTDSTQRVHLFNPTSRGLPPNPAGGNWASWQELRSTDGYWAEGLTNLAKSSLQAGPGGGVPFDVAWGPSGFSVGAVRWWAWDYLLPLNITVNSVSVSFEFVNTWTAFMDMHASSGVDGDPCITTVTPYSGHPRYMTWMNSPVTVGGGAVPYVEVPLLQLTNSNGSRVVSAYNVWHELVVGIRASKDSSGWYEIWHDGVQLTPQTSRVMLNPNENGPYLQIQHYTAYPTNFVGGATRGAIVYGGFRAGLARTDVQTR